MQAIVQRKIAEHNGEQLKALIEDKQKGSRRFWTYVSSLDRRAAMPQIRNEETDLPISDLSEHLTEHMHRLYQPVQSACVAAELNEAEIHYPEDEIMKWQVTRGAVDRAISRIDAHTAKGLDGIPAGVVKHLGDAARDHLADIFSSIVAAESPTDLQQLVTLAATHLYHLDLTFNAKKSAALQPSGSPPGADIYLPGGDQIQWDTEYRYLEVILSTSGDLLGVHEENLRRSSQRAANMLRRKSLWGCNRFLLTRDLWKAVHVPGLTFANAVLCLNVTTRQWLERGQREVGHMALGCHGRVAIEAIQGDLGWSTFEAREARSKATYEGRLRLMDDERWPRRLFRYTSLTRHTNAVVQVPGQSEKKVWYVCETCS
ncbi:hypothetical protein HPB50_014516 [Hyalomma asiaticum]|uniref:Uncharacterized protein n=1 Tax=Hyalomma asiaticum TaxID=266040 RepID=A0ACB7TK26_HYAAI|nr:hypothetical protein HPB50_014516 [Hyalomma asiaticum]